jgi:hypothetical protein
MIINKKAASSLEVIISFVIFIGFIFFLFLIFPVSNTEKSKVGIDAAESGIMNFSSSSLVYFTVLFNETAINEGNLNGCFKFSPDITLGNVSVLDENDTRIEALTIDNEIVINGLERFYQIYSSSDIERGDFQDWEYNDCNEIDKRDFKLSLVRENSVISYNKIALLSEAYSFRYNSLISDFNIPSRENFGYSLREINGEIIIEAMKKKASRNVIARDLPVQILYGNGSLKYAILHIEEW